MTPFFVHFNSNTGNSKVNNTAWNSYLLFMKIIVELHRNKNSNPTRSDFKYPTDFGFRKKCRIPSDSDSESVTSLLGAKLSGEFDTSAALWEPVNSSHGQLITTYNGVTSWPSCLTMLWRVDCPFYLAFVTFKSFAVNVISDFNIARLPQVRRPCWALFLGASWPACR